MSAAALQTDKNDVALVFRRGPSRPVRRTGTSHVIESFQCDATPLTELTSCEESQSLTNTTNFVGGCCVVVVLVPLSRGSIPLCQYQQLLGHSTCPTRAHVDTTMPPYLPTRPPGPVPLCNSVTLTQ